MTAVLFFQAAVLIGLPLLVAFFSETGDRFEAWLAVTIVVLWISCACWVGFVIAHFVGKYW